MARINLLPWRAKLRKERQRDFGIATVVALVVTAGLMGLVHLQIEAMIEYQQGRNTFMRQEITKMDVLIKQIDELEKTKARLIARMEIIQRLQQSRPLVVRMFDELVSVTPEGTYLASLSQTRNTLTIEGYAQSNTRVSAMMRNIEASEWLEEPLLNVIDNTGKGQGTGARFNLTAKLVSGEVEPPPQAAAAKG